MSDSASPWTVACQVPLSTGFFRQEYWRGLPFLLPGEDLPDPEKDHLDPERESETSLWKAPDADDNVKDEGDGCSESELEDDKQGKLFSLSCGIGCLASVATFPYI